VLAGAIVGPGARVEQSIVGPRAWVGARATLEGLTVLGSEAEARPGEHLSGAKRPDSD
jgi:hypothetical protein